MYNKLWGTHPLISQTLPPIVLDVKCASCQTNVKKLEARSRRTKTFQIVLKFIDNYKIKMALLQQSLIFMSKFLQVPTGNVSQMPCHR